MNEKGQRTNITRSGNTIPVSANAAYTYNSRGELISADEATNTADRAFQYDSIGNREKTSNGTLTLPPSNNYTSNALNQYTAIPGLPVAPVHDADGNATAYPLPVNASANAALTYDSENRLIKVVSGSTTIEYIYDALSRRVAQTIGSTRTYYMYDGWNCIAEYTGAVHTSGTAPALTRTYTHTWGLDQSGSMQGAGGVGGLLASSKFSTATTATAHYPLYDGNGNITAYIDAARTVTASFDYDPFGNILNSNNTPALPYAFSTKPRDNISGLYYYGYRWYDPLTGRWPSRDPIQENGGVNLYGFVFNEPTSYIDDTGLMAKDIIGRPPGRKPVPGSSGNITPIRVVIGNVTSALSGDLFHEANPIPKYDKKQCEFLITVSGIRMKDFDTGNDSQRDYYNEMRSLPGQKYIKNPIWINNPSNGPEGMFDYLQILANEMHQMTRVDLDMVRQIEVAAKAAKENKCCCWSIKVIAHSQGTMIFKRALGLIDPDTKKHIHFIGLGGEAILHSNMGLASVLNIAHKDDIIPKLQPGNWWYFREEIDTGNYNPKKDDNDPHSWEYSYLPYLKAHPEKLKKGKVCN